MTRTTRFLSRAVSSILASAALLSCTLSLSCTRAADPEPASVAEETAVLPPAADDTARTETACFAPGSEFLKIRNTHERADAEESGFVLCFDGVELPKAGKLFYLPVWEGFAAHDLLRLSASLAAEDGEEEGGVLCLDSHLTDIGIEPLLTHNTRTELTFRTEDRYVSAELCFTTLPILSADVGRSALSRSDRSCAFSLWEAKNGALRRTDSPAAVRIRGASSASLAKTGLKLSLRDGDGNPNKIPLLGMRRDDDWVLYASYSDNAHVRDAVGWHLWQKMTETAPVTSSDPEHAGALEVRWVELILGGKYDGFYLMMEAMDQKKLSLDFDAGDALFKCVSWDIPMAKALRRLSTRNPAHSSLEKKFPDPKESVGEVHKDDWKRMGDFVWLCYESSGEEFARDASALLDTEQILEYWLFLNLTMAADNTWKNTYYAYTGGKFRAYPWDLDITFGLGWNGDAANNYLWEQPGMDTRTYDFQAGRRLIKYVEGCGDYVRERYESLKEAGICSADALIADAEEQWAILHDSGAWARNLERWPSVSTTGSLDYFKKTVRSREAWMEEYLASLP